jgi:flagellar protein FliJ
MESQRQFGIDTVPNEYRDFARAPIGTIQRDGRNLRVLERLNRLRQLETENARRRCAQIEVMIADFNRIVHQLECEIQGEQARTGIHDPAHFAYSTSATAMIRRRDNLKRSIDELSREHAEAKFAFE